MSAQKDRGLRPTVRNPVLALPAVQKIKRLPTGQRKMLAELLMDIRRDALERANRCWAKHKAPMACYWKAVGVYAGHMARAIR